MGCLQRVVFGISPEEASFTRRGFRLVADSVQTRLEEIARTFIAGYHAALLEDNIDVLGRRLQEVGLEKRGFAFEGAAMGLTLLDLLTPWRTTSRLQTFVHGPGADHVYMVHVGAGWALARLPLMLNRTLRRLDPLLRWLALDGFGFHQGYFHWQRYVAAAGPPNVPAGYAQRAFDQGLGRSLWFSQGANPPRIADTINSLPAPRRANLWSGVGLAAAYADGVERGELEMLLEKTGQFRPELAQGTAFAAKAREKAGNPAPHTDLACRILCGRSAAEAAALTDTALQALPDDTNEPAYEAWRRRIQAHFREDRS